MFNDKEIRALIAQEKKRQQTTLNLIASENICWPEVMEMLASCLTNKYAEGKIGRRFYAGCEIVDQVEMLAQERCKKLFNAEYANVQPHSGTQANMIAYKALLNPGDALLSMDFSCGGHLSHGHKLSLTGALYKVFTYGVNRESELIDYEEVQKITDAVRPRLLLAGASSYSRFIDYERMAAIAKSVGAYFMVDMAHVAGLVAAGVHPSPVPYADVITSTTHKTLRGPRGAFILARAELGELIDRAVMPGVQGGPFMHVIAAKATAFLYAMQSSFKEYQQEVVECAKLFADILGESGMRPVSGGTDTHLVVFDLTSLGLTGAEAEEKLAKKEIFVNRNAIPYDPLSPRITSGIRIGTPFIVAQGYVQKDIRDICIKMRSYLEE